MTKIVNFLKSVKKKKFWDIKDTYLYKANLGNHWHIKKFTVLYKHILADKDKINQKTLETISKNFENFCNSIENEKIKKDAINYFFKPDIRKKDKFIDFEKYNDVSEYDDNARKFFMLRLLNEGGESRTPIKDRIKVLINENYKMSSIISQIPKIKLDEIAKAKKNKKKPRSVKDSVHVIISDYPATIRNDRQLFSYWGYMPPEENGYVLNQIGELIYQCNDQILLNAIGDHQRFKMRLGNPNLDNMEIKKNFSGREIINQFKNDNDFEDYNTNPVISIFEVLNELKSFDMKDEYKFIIIRITPFNLNKTIELIKESRKNYKKIQETYENLHKQKKTRDFRTTTVSKTENVSKQIKNLMYGSGTEKSKNKNVNDDAFIKIDENISITNKEKFNNYFRVILLIKKILNLKYSKLYSKFNRDYKIKLIREVANSIIDKDDLNEKQKNNYINSLENLKKKLITNKQLKEEEFNLLIENNWEEYISNIDPEFLLICYALNLCVDQFEISQEKENIKYELPSFFVKNNHGSLILDETKR